MVEELVLPRFDPPWSSEIERWSRWQGSVHLQRDASWSATMEWERCARGRLQHCYPVAADDIEVKVVNIARAEDLSSILQTGVRAMFDADPKCRKIVYAVDISNAGCDRPGVLAAIAAAQTAGLRYVVDVDIVNAELSLLVAENTWVTSSDFDLDRVPGT